MANGVGKHKLLVIGPTEPWSVREKLCLATSVMKSGDQNWVSVSRAIKPFAEPGRPPDWFSQKHCASKYSELLENTEAPKRKRGEKGEVVETVEDVIVRRLTAERIEELKRLIKETQERHRALKRESELIQAGHLDSKLEELWQDIVQKKKQEEEEAEIKRKTTDAAYRARQVAKIAPKRVAGVTLHSPPGSSPSQEFSHDDPLESIAMDFVSSKNSQGSTRLMLCADSAGSVSEDITHVSLLDDTTQKKLLVQKGTPPPSPLLSELLKKGNLLASNARLLGDGDLLTATNMTGVHDLQLVSPCQPLSQATGAPMLSRLLEARPSQLGFMVGTESASNTPTSASTPVAVPGCTEVDMMIPAVPRGCQPAPAGLKVSELSEEDVSVSYMGDELDLKTVGDIIAIIEDKVDESAEALDAAAVEAALSLCEENGHALPATWEAESFQPHSSHPAVAPVVPQASSFPSSLAVKPEGTEAQNGTSNPPYSLCGGPDNCLTALPTGFRGLPSHTVPPCNSRSLDHCHNGAPLQPEAVAGALVNHEGQLPFDVAVKCHSEKWTQQTPNNEALQQSPMAKLDVVEVKDEVTSLGGEASGLQIDSEVNGPDVCGEDDGDAIDDSSSEPELEPAASESEDGYSLHTASSSLQLHTTADSIPSSPASSQFSMCSEDLEALQAQKIWKKAIMLVWRAAANHRYANVFLQPVTDDIAPGYHSIVHRPMDLATIKKNIENGLIRTTAEFQRDIMLMFQNAVMYNSLDHDVYLMALEMQRDVMEQIQQFLATQLIMETSESGISAKSLRGRDGMRRQDSTDKDGGTRGRRCAIEADQKMKK
ncbi:bromodomain-containing protein 8 isoform 2-T2 [Synchiropus picturatus]